MTRAFSILFLMAGLSTTLFGQHLISPFDGNDTLSVGVAGSHIVSIPARWFCPYHQRSHDVVFVEVSCPLGDEHCHMHHFAMLCSEGNRGQRLFAEVTQDVARVCRNQFPLRSVRYIELAIQKPENGRIKYEEISDVMRVDPNSKYNPQEWSAGKLEYAVTTTAR